MKNSPNKSSLHDFAENEALKSAMDLLAYSSAYLPSAGERLKKVLYERLLSLAVSFAVNARRCLEIEKKRDVLICERRWKYQSNETQLVNLNHALNGIVHAKNLSVRIHEGRHPAFTDMDTLLVLCYSFETEHRSTQTVDVFGMVWSFLHRAPAVNG